MLHLGELHLMTITKDYTMSTKPKARTVVPQRKPQVTVLVYAAHLFDIYPGIVFIIVISKFLKRYSKAKRTRAPAYSRALRLIKGGFPRGGSREAQIRFPE